MNAVDFSNGKSLCFDGELTVGNAAALKEGILEALEQDDRVELDLEAVTAIDLAALQLLCSAHRTALSWRKSMILKGSLSPALQQACAVAGFDLQRSCRFNRSGDCFWTGG